MLWMGIFGSASGATVGNPVLVRNPNIYIALLSQVSPEVLDQIQSMVPYDVPEVAPEVAPTLMTRENVRFVIRRLTQAGAEVVLRAIRGCISGVIAAEVVGIGSILPIIMNPNHADGNDVGIWEGHLNHENVAIFQLVNGMFIGAEFGSIAGGVIGGVVGVVGGTEPIAAALDIANDDIPLLLPVAAGAAAGLSMFADILMRYGFTTWMNTVSMIPPIIITLVGANSVGMIPATIIRLVGEFN